jgi:hypothetical protein
MFLECVPFLKYRPKTFGNETACRVQKQIEAPDRYDLKFEL